MRIVDNKLVADNEDYRLPPNEIRVDHIKGPDGNTLVTFRVLTEGQQLFCAAVGVNEPEAVQMATGLRVLRAAEAAESVLPFVYTPQDRVTQRKQIIDARGQAL